METGAGVTIAFWIIAVVLIASALAVVFVRNVFRAAIALIVAFLAVAGIYVTLRADFLAAVQILIYVGAVAVLLIFAIVLTRDVPQGNPANQLRLSAFILSGLFLAVLIVAVLSTNWQISNEPALENTTGAIATALFDKNTGFILPFEVASVMLLAAIIGAIVLVREK